MSDYRGFRDLIVYQKSYKLALEIFEITKTFPKEEKYSLVDQIRRSSRSVPGNIAKAWVKRKYPKSFVSKLLDSLAEEAETEVWIDTSKDARQKMSLSLNAPQFGAVCRPSGSCL